MLLLLWIFFYLVGFGMIWYGLRDRTTGVHDFVDCFYFAGVGYFTVGFGDIVAKGDFARILTLVQAFIGIVTTALVIGHLPTLYGAYGRRETQLLMIDDLESAPAPSTQPSLIASEETFRHAYDRLAGFGLGIRPFEDAWRDLQVLRGGYARRSGH